MRYKSESAFFLEITRDNERLKISAYEKSPEDEKTVRHYEFHNICDDEIKKTCASVVDLLNRANRHGKVHKKILKELQTTGQLLYDSLLTSRVKEKLATTNTSYLVLSIDDRLVHIPWELLFDGNSFLCQMFNMGRVVSTRQMLIEPAVRKINRPIKVLIIADPRGDLGASHSEGLKLRDELDKDHEIVEAHLRSISVDVNYVKGAIRDFDIVHYAGHADYDLNNPSNSGFQMKDGKFKTTDIMNMIGPKPLPYLVFSNACKSGHTEIWKVREGYETEIYGLANAFLLAGVQHYVGTFWDVQDETGLHFALDFYKELIRGATIGEAVRKARAGMMERYGEDTVVWASYMLYGDPMFRYVDLSQPEERDEGEKDITAEEGKTLRGNVRGMEEVLAASTRKWKGKWIGPALILFLFLMMAFFILRTRNNTLSQQRPPEPLRITESKESKEKRVDELVASLIKDFKEGQRTEKREAEDEWRSRPVTLVFLNVKANGITDEEKDYILSLVTNTLQSSKRVHVVEREVLDKLLEELKLSSSELADPAAAIKIGRILSARLISTGSIIRDDGDWHLSMRMIETETTAIKAALTEGITTKDIKEVAESLGRGILGRVMSEYPLQGRILSLEGERAVLDVGSKEGVTVGLKMEVISETSGARLGDMEVISTDEERSYAHIKSRHGEFKKGSKVKELS